jgi:hypothetical protein
VIEYAMVAAAKLLNLVGQKTDGMEYTDGQVEENERYDQAVDERGTQHGQWPRIQDVTRESVFLVPMLSEHFRLQVALSMIRFIGSRTRFL